MLTYVREYVKHEIYPCNLVAMQLQQGGPAVREIQELSNGLEFVHIE
jgi:hypothetical protein